MKDNFKDYILERIAKLENDCDYYLEKLDDRHYQMNWSIFEQRLHDYRIEIMTLKDILYEYNVSRETYGGK